MPLSALPFELLEEILLNVDPVQFITACRLVCHAWKSAIETTPSLKYYAATGLRPGSQHRYVHPTTGGTMITPITPLSLLVIARFWDKLQPHSLRPSLDWKYPRPQLLSIFERLYLQFKPVLEKVCLVTPVPPGRRGTDRDPTGSDRVKWKHFYEKLICRTNWGSLTTEQAEMDAFDDLFINKLIVGLHIPQESDYLPSLMVLLCLNIYAYTPDGVFGYDENAAEYERLPMESRPRKVTVILWEVDVRDEDGRKVPNSVIAFGSGIERGGLEYGVKIDETGGHYFGMRPTGA
ncbi:hypothetical protein ABW19_dt0204412 [Dactylella cylindrospora]|nr:hypothetical protein ABW19_dt0204412 [Dactylella cylindrospora]